MVEHLLGTSHSATSYLLPVRGARRCSIASESVVTTALPLGTIPRLWRDPFYLRKRLAAFIISSCLFLCLLFALASFTGLALWNLTFIPYKYYPLLFLIYY